MKTFTPHSRSRWTSKRADRSLLLEHRRRVASASVPLLGLVLAACAEPAPRDLGFTQSAQQLGAPSDDQFFTPVTDFSGTWIGVAEEPLALSDDGMVHTYHFPSGSSSIVVEVNADGHIADGQPGHITFGAGEPPPPSEDADAGYPVGVAYDALTGYKVQTFGDQNQYTEYASSARMLPPFEGFAYRINFSGADAQGGVGDGVLSLDYNTNEPLAAWCEMQTSYEHVIAPGNYSCVPDYGGQYEVGSDGTGQMCNFWGPPDYSQCGPTDDPAFCQVLGDPMAQVNCDKVWICSTGYCSCDATSCAAAPTIAHLTVRRTGDELIGVFEDARFKNARGLNTPIGNVHLRRQ